MPTHTKPPSHLSKDAERVLMVINDMSGADRINSIYDIERDPSAFKPGQPITLGSLMQHLGWDKARLMSATNELSRAGFIRQLEN